MTCRDRGSVYLGSAPVPPIDNPVIMGATEGLLIDTGCPWENGYMESFNGKMRDEVLNRELLTTLREARVLITKWRQENIIKSGPIVPLATGHQLLRLSWRLD